MARLTLSQLSAQIEELRVRCDRQEAALASKDATIAALRLAHKPQAQALPVPCRRYTTRDGSIYEVRPEFSGGRTIKRHVLIRAGAGAH